MNNQSMRTRYKGAVAAVSLGASLGLMPTFVSAFDSGSTGTIDFAPTVSQTVPLPADGILQYVDVNIPAGVVITFTPNATNTPVRILASGDVTIAGEINISGRAAASTGTSGDGNLGNDGIPGAGGIGGFRGGVGGVAGADPLGSVGLGPGGGQLRLGGGGGGGGGFGAAGRRGFLSGSGSFGGDGGPAYGAATLLPLIGGSGGAGGSHGANFNGAGGGGGGGAILIAASGTVNITGSIRANGGRGGLLGGVGAGAPGGSGSGGAIRIVATTIAGNGVMQANGAAATGRSGYTGGAGAIGRIRLESENFLFSTSTAPAFTFSAPNAVFVAGMPTLRITSVAGMTAPDAPTGSADITLPSTVANPVAVTFETTGVPLGNTVSLSVIPSAGAPIPAVSDALAGASEASATASASVDLPDGPSVLQATLSFTVTASLGDALRNYAQGEQVEHVLLASSLHGGQTTLVTVSGKRFVYPSGTVPLLN